MAGNTRAQVWPCAIKMNSFHVVMVNMSVSHMVAGRTFKNTFNRGIRANAEAK